MKTDLNLINIFVSNNLTIFLYINFYSINIFQTSHLFKDFEISSFFEVVKISGGNF